MGLPELFRRELAGATLVANPGCYPTAAAIGIAPLLTHSLVKPTPIIINASSGASGAGRAAKAATSYLSVNEAYGPYGTIGGHRHQPEIAQTLSRVSGQPVDPLFVPHLLPLDRGHPRDDLPRAGRRPGGGGGAVAAFEDSYGSEPFVRVRGPEQALPNVKHVAGTNFVDVTVRLVQGRVVVVAAEDNLIKGASGQAIQNMNAMFELDETLGLL